MRVLVTGGHGQLGRALLRTAPAGMEVVALGSSDCDVTDPATVRAIVARIEPELIVHCAAWTDVDGCERHPERAWRVNALGAQHVATACAEAGAALVYISTNYVFDGERDEPYHEFDRPNPLSVYGASKLAGEEVVRALCPRHAIVRTAMLYDAHSRNFVTTVLRLAREQPRLRMVADQYGNPTFVDDLARALWQLVAQPAYGMFHLVNQGAASWYDWAVAVLELLDLAVPVDPIPASEFRRAARPPRNGVLTSLAAPALGIIMPDWRDALARCLTSRRAPESS
ncbi:dTDP-4-dehydrorhamnose reductase [Thermomicrobium sp. CFH 73360]|uniref:dTDP-4-dehydrorhamnose reductase n=1 Tax=Thermomicrobium sp. CFH 73360 TaxID=2951987 RepID=UPI002076BB19|nr:dTDP-4-dehydrorhamnose reductase [Thermomicrobium sp. CFH 73360]MCM8745489.1 dTDP-4-dehydrorhamnose reductase [Thermomicrobium sp. CFH 73360]